VKLFLWLPVTYKLFTTKKRVYEPQVLRIRKTFSSTRIHKLFFFRTGIRIKRKIPVYFDTKIFKIVPLIAFDRKRVCKRKNNTFIHTQIFSKTVSTSEYIFISDFFFNSESGQNFWILSDSDPQYWRAPMRTAVRVNYTGNIVYCNFS
jgi:hypothetical protein